MINDSSLWLCITMKKIYFFLLSYDSQFILAYLLIFIHAVVIQISIWAHMKYVLNVNNLRAPAMRSKGHLRHICNPVDEPEID